LLVVEVLVAHVTMVQTAQVREVQVDIVHLSEQVGQIVLLKAY
jgi:hypothetical protein